MGMRLTTYIGPYLILPKDFDLYDGWDIMFADGRGELGSDDDYLILIPNQIVPGIERELTVDQYGGQQLVQIGTDTIMRESVALSRFADPLIRHCEENGIEITVTWGVVPCWS